MKVLIASESYWPNQDGGAVFERRLAQQLVEDGHRVVVMAPGTKTRSYDEVDGSTQIYRTTSIPVPFNSRNKYRVTIIAKARVQDVLRREKPDIIHVHTQGILGQQLTRAARKHNIPIVATNHLMPENVLMTFPLIKDSNTARKLFWRSIVNFHNNFLEVTTPTPSAAKFLEQFGIVPKVQAITNGVNTKLYRPSCQGKSQVLVDFSIPAQQYMIYLGRVNAEKNIDMILRSYARLSGDEREATSLVIAGVGNRSQELRRLACTLGIDSTVVFAGLVSDDDKIRLLQHALYYVITSPAELQSIATMEAMACGLPVLAVDVAALSELCHDGENGYLVRLNDDTALASAMRRLIDDDRVRSIFGRRSREIVKESHSHIASYKAYMELYRRHVNR